MRDLGGCLPFSQCKSHKDTGVALERTREGPRDLDSEQGQAWRWPGGCTRTRGDQQLQLPLASAQ